jgi:hypothetical protein
MADQDEEQFGVKFAATTESVTQAKESFQHLTQEMEQTAKASETVATTTKTVDDAAAELRKQIDDLNIVLIKQAELYAAGELPLEQFLYGNKAARTVIGQLEGALDSITPKLEEVAGQGDGEAGKGGLKGMAGAAIKAEKAIGMLVGTGGGLGRLPGMLEGVAGALGLASGAGLAAGGLILAFESIIPKVETFIAKMDGAAEATKRAAEALKLYQAEVKKEEEAPTEDEEKAAAVVKEVIKGKGAQELRQGIEQSLIQGGIGLTAEQRAGQYLNPETGQMTKFSPEEMVEFGQRSREAAQARAGQLMLELRKGAPGAIAAIGGMSHVSEELRTRLAQATPEAIEAAKKQSDKAIADSEWADTTYAKQVAATKESAGIDTEFDKALKDKRKHAATDYDAAMKLAADIKVELDTKAEHEAKAARTKAEHDAKAARTEADRKARESTPEAVEHRALAAERNEEMGMAKQVQAARAGMGDVMAAQMGPGELQQVVAQVGKNRLMNSSLGFTLAQQVDYYMSQLEAKMVEDFTRGMGQHDRSRQNTNPRGGL